MKMRGADLLVRTLREAGVKIIFSLSGNQIMPVYDACIDTGIEIIHVRHEAAAVFMAEAYAQITGDIGVVLVTAAPGYANAIGPLYCATCSESPVLLLSGDSPVSQDGRGAFQELDQISLARPVTKLSIRCCDADQLDKDVIRSISVATSGRKGPVHIALPFDVLNSTIEKRDPVPAACHTEAEIDVQKLQDFAKIVSQAERPLILAGPFGNRPNFKAEIERLQSVSNIPVVVMESPRALNDPALGNIASQISNADVVLSLGKKVDFVAGFGSFGENQRWFVIDPDKQAINLAHENLGTKLADTIQKSMTPDFIRRLISIMSDHEKGDDEWMSEVQEAMRKRISAERRDGSKGLLPDKVCEVVQSVIADHPDSILIQDGGEFGQWAQAGVTAATRIINGVSGAIGGGICYAIGAKKSSETSPVFCMMGDGTAGFHFMEFETAVRNNIPFVAIIGNDAKWNAEYAIQMRDYGPDRLIGCELSDTRFDQVAAAMGACGEYVDAIDDLRPALERAIACGKPACINIALAGVPAPKFQT